MSKKSVPALSAVTPKVEVIVSGTTYTLAFDFNALATAEELTKLNLLRALDFQALSASTFRALLFASLLKFHPDFTLEQAGSLINSKSAPELMSAVVKAWGNATPEQEDDAPKNE